MKYVLFLIAILFSNRAVALDCSKQPTCEELNYSKEDNPKCDKNGYILCPFDSQYKKCVNFSCESLGFTQSEKSDWCADIATCKGDKSYTLCQTPCLAWDYETLSNLAESGKCKVITMKNDITIPQNESITLAEDTTIDGGGYTITATGNKENYHVFVLDDNNVFKNLNVSYTSEQNKNDNFLFYSQSNTTFENVNLNFAVSSSDTSGVSRVIYHGNLVLRGNVNINIEAEYYVNALSNLSLDLENADVKIISKGANAAGEMLNNVNKLNAQNSKLIVQASIPFMAGLQTSYILENSTIEISDSFYWTSDSTNIPDVTLKESTFTVGGRLLTGSARNAIFRLQGTTDNPSKLIFKTSSDFGQAKVETTNTTDTLILNGVTYRPKQIGTTLLSEIPTSPNWEIVK